MSDEIRELKDGRDVRQSLAQIKALAHGMVARYQMGLDDPTHRAKFDRKRRELRQELDALDAWLDGGWARAAADTFHMRMRQWLAVPAGGDEKEEDR